MAEPKHKKRWEKGEVTIYNIGNNCLRGFELCFENNTAHSLFSLKKHAIQ